MEVSRGKTLRKPLLSGVSCSCRTSRVGSWTPHLPQSWSYPGWMVLWSIFARSFFLNQFLNFNWRLNSSQYCGFFLPYINTNQPQGYMCPTSQTPLPPPSPSHPSGFLQCPSFECAVSCIQLVLVIYLTYGNIHVSVLFSQIISSLPSPRVQKFILHICVSFALSRIGVLLPSF